MSDLNNDAATAILARSRPRPKANDWRAQLRQAFRRPADLLTYLGLDDRDDPLTGISPTPAFPMLVPRAFAERMQPGRWDDPLLRQVLPDRAETVDVAGFISDPVGDHSSRQVRGLLHKYSGRALLISTGACAVHCRYCFRQQYPYSDEHLGREFEPALDYINQRRDITEVILSGGDPLMLETRRLADLTGQLARIKHLKRLRIHTRLPVVLPARVDSQLGAWLASLPWQVVIVIHANHAAEFDQHVDTAIARLRRNGALVFNQAVLLAGVNDDEDSLVELMERSFSAGVIPYYLHLLDRVAGAARFDKNRKDALRLHERLRVRLPGYLVPRLVREKAGAPYKLPVL